MQIVQFTRTFAVALVLIVAATGLWAGGGADAEPAAAAEKEMVLDPTTGEMVTAPEYGGTLTYPYKLFGETTDPHITGHYAGYQIYAVNEKLAKGDWGAPRDEVSFTGWYVPFSRFKGHLAESWEHPDDRTLIVKIKPDIRWHDKPPVNGRELTAEDVAFTYRRIAGLLDFEPVFVGLVESYPWESIEALDRYTVEFKLTEPRAGLARAILGQHNSRAGFCHPRSSSSTLTTATGETWSAPGRSCSLTTSRASR